MNIIYAVALTLGLTTSSIAQTNSANPIEEFSANLARLYSQAGEISRSEFAKMNSAEQSDAVFKMMRAATVFQLKWHNRDGVRVTGFRVTGGDQIALEVEFTFK